MTQTDFETFINDPDKRVTGDIERRGGVDHSPGGEFPVEPGRERQHPDGGFLRSTRRY